MPIDPESFGLFPEQNRIAAHLLFVIEVGLRELIIDVLSEIDGPKWYKTALPSDVTQKYIRGQQIERAAKWTTHTAHHPLYYIDFPDLLKVLEKNWKGAFQALFSDKAVFLGQLRSIEPIRNKLAHNRKISSKDTIYLEAVYATFESAVGKDRIVVLVRACSESPSIPGVIDGLFEELQFAKAAMLALANPAPLNHWPVAKQAWWFDSQFLTSANHSSRLELAETQRDSLNTALQQAEREIERLRECAALSKNTASHDDAVAPIREFFAIYETFQLQPRSRGTGHKLEAWLGESDIPGAAQRAESAITFLKSSHE